jgi:hypothetical protein
MISNAYKKLQTHLKGPHTHRERTSNDLKHTEKVSVDGDGSSDAAAFDIEHVRGGADESEQSAEAERLGVDGLGETRLVGALEDEHGHVLTAVHQQHQTTAQRESLQRR